MAPNGCYYAPYPSSQLVCSIGGNIAENSGGAHCLKYGFTVHHVLGVEATLPNGELVHSAARRSMPPGLDLLRRARRLRRHARGGDEGDAPNSSRPEAVLTLLAGFESIEAAGGAVRQSSPRALFRRRSK